MAGLTADQQVSVPTLTASWLSLTFVHWPVRVERLQAAECVHLEESLTAEAGLPVEGPPLVHFAERVMRVRAGLPRLVG